MKKKQVISLMLVAAMAAGLLAGCGSKEAADTGTASSGTESTADAADAAASVTLDEATGFPLVDEDAYPTEGEISVWHVWSSDKLDDFNDVTVAQYAEEATGIHVNWTTVSREEREEKFGILISSGDLPDLIYAQSSTYPGGMAAAVEDGVFMDVTEFAEEYVPNYIAILEANPEVKKACTTDDGRLLCFYQLNCTNQGLQGENEFLGLYIRQDWLDELGLDVPETIDDWHTVLSAFKNDLGVEAPLMIGPSGTLINGAFTSAYGVMPDFYQEDGTVKFGPCEEGYKEFVETFREWYAEGLIDQNFMTNNVERFPDWSYTTTGLTGAFTHAYSMAYDGMITAGQVTDNDDFWLTPVANPVLNEGDTPSAIPLAGSIVGDPMYVSADCDNLETLGAWLNYMYSEENVMMQFGKEGTDYVINDDGQVEFTEAITNNPDMSASDAFSLLQGNWRFGMSNWYSGMLYNGLETTEKYLGIEDIWTSQDMSKNISSKITMTTEESEEYSTLYSDISTYVDENICQFIMGTKSMDEWDSFVEQLHSMGIDDCIAIYQAALDRYNAR